MKRNRLNLFLILGLLVLLSSCSREIINSNYLTNEKKEPLNLNEQEPAPVASKKNIVVPIPRGGVYDAPFRLRFSSSNPKTDVYYSFDIKNYDPNTFTRYSSPILIDRDLTLRYFAKINGKSENVQQTEYRIIPNLKPEKNTDINSEERDKDIQKFLNDFEVKKPQ